MSESDETILAAAREYERAWREWGEATTVKRAAREVWERADMPHQSHPLSLALDVATEKYERTRTRELNAQYALLDAIREGAK